MITCFIDPIFLAVKESSLYSEEIYPIFSKFFKKIKFLEEILGKKRFIKFNISPEVIYECYTYSPYQINQIKGNKAWNKWYKGFLEQLFKVYRNNKCEDLVQSTQNSFEFTNTNVPLSIIEKWNKFLNNCDKCKNSNVPCHQNDELLTLQKFGSKLISGTKPFNCGNANIYNWLVEKFNLVCHNLSIKFFLDKPPVSKIHPKNKKEGDWRHHHNASVLRDIDKLTNCKYIEKIMPGGHSSKSRIDKIYFRPENSPNLLEIHLNGQEKVEIFYLYTTAENVNQMDPILDEIWKIIPSLTLCD